MNCVKHAIEIISSRLRESQHRDRSHFSNRLHSPERLGPADDDFHAHNTGRRSSVEGPSFGPRYSSGSKSNNYSSSSLGYALESGPSPLAESARPFSGEDLVFRILCPVGKIECIVGELDGIMDLLQNEIGVHVVVADPIAGSDEHIINIISDEGPNDELFPAQEALLHIQTRMVDILPENGNVITTRLLMQSDEIGCLVSKDCGSLLGTGKIPGANVEILPREKLPSGFLDTDEIVQIVGEIKAAREALIEITTRVRSYTYGELAEKEVGAPPVSAPSPLKEDGMEPESARRNHKIPSLEHQARNGPNASSHQSTSATTPVQKVKDSSPSNPNDVAHREDNPPSVMNRISLPLVTRSTLEVVIPPHTASKLVAKSRKIAFISEISGATVKLIDDSPETTGMIIQISGTPDQAEKAQSLLQGFMLSTEDG